MHDGVVIPAVPAHVSAKVRKLRVFHCVGVIIPHEICGCELVKRRVDFAKNCERRSEANSKLSSNLIGLCMYVGFVDDDDDRERER